jgi:hypothetical protein
MPINNQNKLQQLTTGDDSQSLSRPGGAASMASAKIAPTKGSAWAAMENTLLHGLSPDAEALSNNSTPSRQFNKLANGGDAKGAAKSPKAFSAKQDRFARATDSAPMEGRSKVKVRLFKRFNLNGK